MVEVATAAGGPLFATGAKAAKAGRAASKGIGRLGKGDLLKDHASGGAGLLADLGDDGILNLYIKVGPGTPKGGQMFNEAMQAFGPNVKGVRGTWIGGGDIADNFDAFKAAAAGGASLDFW